MSSVHHHSVDEMVEAASLDVGLLWPLDRSVAANPLVDRIDDDFVVAAARLSQRLGVSVWPGARHLDELARRDLALPRPVDGNEHNEPRPPTMLERGAAGAPGDARAARSMVGHLLLEATMVPRGEDDVFLDRVAGIATMRSSWAAGPRRVGELVRELLSSAELADIVGRLKGWEPAAIEEEMARHFARLPGWAAWAKWNDCWAPERHAAAVRRAEFLAVSMAVDLAWLAFDGREVPDPPRPESPAVSSDGQDRLSFLERAVHGDMLRRMSPQHPIEVAAPQQQVVVCIDVRSEPLRRALERDQEVATFGFAGFFGVPATVTRAGEAESYASLPVLVPPSVRIKGGPQSSELDVELATSGGTLAELTHEPSAMFALAEATGFLAAPWLVARSTLPRLSARQESAPGEWTVEADDRVGIAEGALRAMGLTRDFAPEVLFLGHSSRTSNNPHFASLACGACAGHAGGPNAAALAAILNDAEVRQALADRGISIPPSTLFLSGEHDTTTESVTVHGPASDALQALLDRATGEVAAWRAGGDSRRHAAARRRLERRATDWAEVRPEWGLADHVAFVVAPRSSIRGVDLGGRAFLHSYDPAADGDGAILSAILAAPMVVAQWINAAYYFSSVAPEVLGAGDKTLLNPVGDFGVIEGEDPDLKMGLPWQSIATGERPVHLPVRLLVCVEAPLDRITAAVDSSPLVRSLVGGAWVHLAGRATSLDAWQRWDPRTGWSAS